VLSYTPGNKVKVHLQGKMGHSCEGKRSLDNHWGWSKSPHASQSRGPTFSSSTMVVCRH
jgi:hypothetical protein